MQKLQNVNTKYLCNKCKIVIQNKFLSLEFEFLDASRNV